MQHLLNSEQQLAVRDQIGPISVVDPTTNRVYVLLPQEQYERLRASLDEVPLSPEQQRQLLLDAGRRAGWDDPEMADYDRYDEVRNRAL